MRLCQFYYGVILVSCLLAATPAFALPFPFSSGNPSNDKLMSMSDADQSAMLSKAMHYVCLAKDPYYMGTEKQGVNKGVSFWSVTCDKSDKKFLIIIAPDAIGSTKVIQCNLLHGLPWTCYEKLKY